MESKVNLLISEKTYGGELDTPLFDQKGGTGNVGLNFGDLETGIPSDVKYFYIRHDGKEQIYACGVYIKAVGTKWGGYVAGAASADRPYNPNFFRSGGLDSDGLPETSTKDYELLRTVAMANPEMGIRLHMDRTNKAKKSEALGYANSGLSFNPKLLEVTALDFSGNTGLLPKAGVIYPKPVEAHKVGTCGDEAKLGISINIPEEVEGSGHVQVSVAIKYRYTK